MDELPPVLPIDEPVLGPLLALVLSYISSLPDGEVVMCGGIVYDACRDAEFSNDARVDCFQQGGVPKAASYHIPDDTRRTIDICRYAETNTNAYDECVNLNGIPWGASGYDYSL